MNSVPFGFAYGIWVRNQLGFLLCAVGLVTMALFYPLLFALSKAVHARGEHHSTGLHFHVCAELDNFRTGDRKPGFELPQAHAGAAREGLVAGPLANAFRLGHRGIASGGDREDRVPLERARDSTRFADASRGRDRFVVSSDRVDSTEIAPGSFCDRSGSHAGAGRFLCGSSSVEIRTRKLWSSPFWPHTSWRRMRLAFAAVRSERRGDSWQLWFSSEVARRGVDSAESMRSVRGFRSAATAQFWYEWRCHGAGSLIFLGVEMFMIWGILLSTGKPIDAARLPLILTLLLLAPVAVIGSTGQVIGRFRPLWVTQRPFNTFLHVRPIASAAVVAGKLRLALVLTVSSWVFVLFGTFACLVLTRSLPGMTVVWHRFTSAYPAPAHRRSVCSRASSYPR